MNSEIKPIGTAIAEFNEFDAQMVTFRERYDGVVYDMENKATNKQARSDRLAIAKVISKLDEKHKKIKAPLKERVDLIDSERKRIKDQLIAIRDGVKAQIDAYEEKEAERERSLAAKVLEIRNLAAFLDQEPSADAIATRLATARSIVVDGSYGDYETEAAVAHARVIEEIETRLAKRITYETEQAELAALRAEKEQREREDRERQEATERADREARAATEQAEREERLKREAAEQARREAADAHAKAIETAERAQREAEQAAERARQEERERIEAEQRKADEQARAEVAAEAKRVARKAHRNSIHREAIDALVEHGALSKPVATIVVNLIADGVIQHVSITY